MGVKGSRWKTMISERLNDSCLLDQQIRPSGCVHYLFSFDWRLDPDDGERCARRSISRVLCLAPRSERRPFLWDARHRAPRATDPDDSSKTSLLATDEIRSPRVAPIWSCSEWGLPCRSRYRNRGALLPPRFTLARPREGTSAVSSLLHFPWVRTRRALPGTLVSVEPGLSSNDLATARGRPTVWRSAM